MLRKMLWSLLLLIVAWLVVPARSGLTITKPELQKAVESLSTMLHNIRNEGLGIDDLEEALLNVTFREDVLTETDIRSLLADNILQTRVDAVQAFFNNVSSNYATGEGTPETPVSCCNQTSSPGACAQGPPGVSADSTIFGDLSLFQEVSGQVVMFGAPDGSIITAPYSNSCEGADSRIQSWFLRGARVNARPLEVVILMDYLEDRQKLVNRTKAAATSVIQSLSTNDRVGVVIYDSLVLRVSGGISQVVPICDSSISEMDNFINSISKPTNFIPYTGSTLAAGIERANGLFTNRTDTDKHLLFFTLTTLGPSLKTAFNNAVGSLATGVTLTIFNGNSLSDNVVVAAAAAAAIGSAIYLNPARNFANLIGVYSVPSTFNSANTDVIVGRNNVIGKGAVLTLTQPVFNGTEFVGVLYSAIPFSSLIPGLQDALRMRPLSYVFVLGQDQLGLLHPLLPSDSLAVVNASVLEPEGVIESYLASGFSSPAPVVKLHLLSTGTVMTYHSYVVRNVSSAYHCSSVNTAVGSFIKCLVLADGNEVVRSLNAAFVDVANLYSRYLPPIYHAIKLSAQGLDVCNYFCKQSVSTHISFQLTVPSSPTSEDNSALVTALSNYITSANGRPTYVQEGVAEEAAVGLAVAESWLNLTSRPSDFITRRHLATPSGLYLTYPPAHISPNFQPFLTEWYLTPLAHPTLLTLSPPHGNPLQEGSDITLSLGSAIVPPGNSDATPFAVVSGEITLNSLRLFLDEALPQCSKKDNYECVLFDDRGNLVYRNDLEFIKNTTSFLGRDIDILRALLFQSGASWSEKRQCQDLFNVNIDTNRFYTVTIGQDEVISSSPSHCTSFLIQRIPGMNIFLAVYNKANNCSNSLCFCTTGTCFNCAMFVPGFCECPCSCPGNCAELESGPPLCPLISQESPDYSPQSDSEASNQDSLCFNQECRCRTNFSSCYGVRDCNWCYSEQKCVQNTECCNAASGSDCCRVETRFGNLCSQYLSQCFSNPSGNRPLSCDSRFPVEPTTTLPTQPPRTNRSIAIVAGVVGGILGALLIAFILALFIYYQFFRKADPQEETSRESAFDFSNKNALGIDKAKGKKKKKEDPYNEKEKEAQEEERESTPIKEKDDETTI